MSIGKIEFYENWLCKNKDELLPLGRFDFFGNTLNYLESVNFFGLIHDSFTISHDESNNISLVSLVFPLLLDKQTFEALVAHYGKPNNLFKIDKLISKSKSKLASKTELGFHQNLTKKEFSTKAVKFEENPDWIFWKKKNYELSIRQDFEYKAIHVVYKKSS